MATGLHDDRQDHGNAQAADCIVKLGFAVVILAVGTLAGNFLDVVFGDKDDQDGRIFDSLSHLIDNVSLHSFMVKPRLDTLLFESLIHQNDAGMVVTAQRVRAPVVGEKTVVFFVVLPAHRGRLGRRGNTGIGLCAQ